MTLTALERFVIGDADVLEHVGVAGEQRHGERQEDGVGSEENGEVLGSHGSLRDRFVTVQVCEKRRCFDEKIWEAGCWYSGIYRDHTRCMELFHLSRYISAIKRSR